MDEISEVSREYDKAAGTVAVFLTILAIFAGLMFVALFFVVALSDARTSFLTEFNKSVPEVAKILFNILLIIAWGYLFITYRKLSRVLSQYAIIKMPPAAYAVIWSACFMIFPAGTLISHLVVSRDIRALKALSDPQGA
jgi:hypothetical protein